MRVRECVCIGGRGGGGGGSVCVTEARRAEQVPQRAREEKERHEREQQRQRGETERQTKEALSENIANLCISRPYWKVREGRIRTCRKFMTTMRKHLFMTTMRKYRNLNCTITRIEMV